MSTGKLESGPKGHYVCVDCKTIYLAKQSMDGVAKCNGHDIYLCPWCRPDSAPWKNGRGI